jgi:hypothetical protein
MTAALKCIDQHHTPATGEPPFTSDEATTSDAFALHPVIDR